MVKYRQLNLLNDFSQLGMFDLIFCRNVLIYFDQDTKVDVLNRLAQRTAGDGYLVLGAAETVVGLTDRFKMVADKRGLYAPNTPPRLSAVTGAKPARGLLRSTAGGEDRDPRKQKPRPLAGVLISGSRKFKPGF